jgi:hypothetical protein
MPFDGSTFEDTVRINWQAPAFAALLEAERRLRAEAESRLAREIKQEKLRLARCRRETRKQHREKISAHRALCATMESSEICVFEPLSPRIKKAIESVVVLNLLERLFDRGNCWVQHQLDDGQGNRCLVGGLMFIRSVRDGGDCAGKYLSRAISIAYGGGTLIEMNDGADSFAYVRSMIELARNLAQTDIRRHNQRVGGRRADRREKEVDRRGQ